MVLCCEPPLSFLVSLCGAFWLDDVAIAALAIHFGMSAQAP